MTYQGRSLDDLPLAAYSTGVTPEEAEAPPDEPPHMSQQEALAQSLGVDLPGKEGDGARDAAPTAAKGRRSFSLHRLSRPRMPKPQLPKASMPLLGGSAPAVEGPRMSPAAEAPRMTPAVPPFVPPPAATPAMAAASATGTIGAPRTGPVGTLDLGGVGSVLQNPGAALRDPRVLLAGLLLIGLVVLAVSLSPGSKGGVVGDPSSSEAPVVATVAPPTGTAALEIKVKGASPTTATLAGSTGAGPAVDDQLDASWTDTLGNSLAITGRAGSGTRTTSAELILSISVDVDGTQVRFTSEKGECTVGMASQPLHVQGSFVCKELESTDGEHEIDVSGTYRT